MSKEEEEVVFSAHVFRLYKTISADAQWRIKF